MQNNKNKNCQEEALAEFKLVGFEENLHDEIKEDPNNNINK